MAVTSSVETMDLEEAASRANTPMWLQIPDDVDGTGAVDYRGLSANKRKTGGWKACIFIHILLTGDASAIFGIAGNLVPYLTGPLHMPAPESFSTVSNFFGTAYLLPIFWGYLADSYLGHYSTIGASSIICFSGLVLLFLSTTVPSLKPGDASPATAVTWFKAGLYLTAVGAAGLLPCGTSMGQDQFDETDKVEKKKGGFFFTSFYANVNLTALFCVTFLFWIQDNKGYDWGFGIMTGIYFVGVTCFFLATPLYRHRQPGGSALTRVAQVFMASMANMRQRLPDHPSELYELDDAEVAKQGIRKILHTDRLRFLDKAAIQPPFYTLGPEDSGKMRRKLLCTVTQVEELKAVIQILPIWVCCISVYTAFAQLQGVTLLQAQSLDRRIGSLTIPAGSSAAILMITAMCTIPVYDFLIVPYLRKRTGHPQGISDLKRMGVALFLALQAMIAALLVEDRRVKVIARNLPALLAGKPLPMRIYWLFPQFQLLGIVEFLLGVAQLNFFYKETPDSMRGFATALYFTSVSVGYFVSTVLVETVNKYTERSGGWLAADFLTGGLKKFYMLLAVIMVVNWLLFLLISHWYKFRRVVDETSWKKGESDHSKQSTEVPLKGEGGPTAHFQAPGPGDDCTLRISMNEASAVATDADDAGTSPKVPNDKSSTMSPKHTPVDTKSDQPSDLPAQSKLD